MSKPAKRPRDPAQLAKFMIDIASGEVEDREPTPEEQGKDPAAVKRGQLGGSKGGKARAAKMTAPERKASALRAINMSFGMHAETQSSFQALDRSENILGPANWERSASSLGKDEILRIVERWSLDR